MLRACGDPAHPQQAPRWRRIARWLARAYPGQAPEDEDARQETLIALTRHVGGMRAEHPGQAAAWVRMIHRRKRLDGIRARRRDPVRQALSLERRDGEPPEIDELPAKPTTPLPEDAEHLLERVVETLLHHTDLAVAEACLKKSKALLLRTQARAAILRLVHRHEVSTIEAALGQHEPLTKARIYKWVERGRKVVELGIDRWAAQDPDAPESVLLALRALMSERRADAGKTRAGHGAQAPARGPGERSNAAPEA